MASVPGSSPASFFDAPNATCIFVFFANPRRVGLRSKSRDYHVVRLAFLTIFRPPPNPVRKWDPYH